jgi:hypothetical protein
MAFELKLECAAGGYPMEWVLPGKKQSPDDKFWDGVVKRTRGKVERDCRYCNADQCAVRAASRMTIEQLRAKYQPQPV